jgi:hypothetical protein
MSVGFWLNDNVINNERVTCFAWCNAVASLIIRYDFH